MNKTATLEVGQDMLKELVVDSDESEESSDEDYLKQRDHRIAEMWAEFHLQFPTFLSEVQGLKVVRTGKRDRKRQTHPIALRKSSRFHKEDHDLEISFTAEGLSQSESPVNDEDAELEEGMISEPEDEGGDAVDAALGTGAIFGHLDGDRAALGTGDNREVPHEVLECGDDSDLGKFVCLPCGMKFR